MVYILTSPLSIIYKESLQAAINSPEMESFGDIKLNSIQPPKVSVARAFLTGTVPDGALTVLQQLSNTIKPIINNNLLFNILTIPK
jgi:hypothetical protein